MATSEDCSQATQVLLVDSQSLPLILQGNAEEDSEDSSNIPVDLLQQALQGASAMDDGEDTPSATEVNLDTLSSNDSGVVAIFQSEGGRTQTLKISLAQAESLGLHFTSDNYPVEDSLDGMKEVGVTDQLAGNNVLSVQDSSFLPSVSNMVTEGRIIDEEGNIVQGGGALPMVPSSLNTLLEGGMNQSITIIPQYGFDGTLTYAVKLKDQDGNVLAPDYRLMEPDSSAKTGLDIEEEITRANLKQDMLQAQVSIPLQTSISLSVPDSICATAPISLPMTTLESLTKQISGPITPTPSGINTSVPIAMGRQVSLSLSAVANNSDAVNRYESAVPAVTNVHSSPSVQNQFFRLIPDRGSLNLGSSSSQLSLCATGTNIISQPISGVARLCTSKLQSGSVQHTPLSPALLQPTRLTLSGTSLLEGNQVSSNLAIVSGGKTAVPKPRLSTAVSRQSSLLTTSSRSLPISASKVMPVSVATPSSSVVTRSPAPAMAAVAPLATQPAIGAASTAISSNGRQTATNINAAKPLGSSENPIQLVQQGQTFHSMQALSQSQLRQIATVLQQKHLNTNSVTKNVLFDEQTKTRIVYRVVYPEDVDLQQPGSPTDAKEATKHKDVNTPGKGRGKRGRPPKKNATQSRDGSADGHGENASPTAAQEEKVKSSENDDENCLEEITAKVERKKVIGARTRSGRVSRPPKHMLKDFKRLHHLDYQEQDLDDSDGGYSDYNINDCIEKTPEKDFKESKEPSESNEGKDKDLKIPKGPKDPKDSVDPKDLNDSKELKDPNDPTEPMELMEAEEQNESQMFVKPVKGYSPAKKRMSRYSCPTCGKIYLGHTRMERHFVQFPDHGSIEEFKQSISEPAPTVKKVVQGPDQENKQRSVLPKPSSPKGKRRVPGSCRSDRERSDCRKKKLQKAVEACEVKEVLEVVGPLLACYYSLWDLLLLRLDARDKEHAKQESAFGNLSEGSPSQVVGIDCKAAGKKRLELSVNVDDSDKGHIQRVNSNKVRWLLMELSSLADTLQSMAGDLLHPTHLHSDANNIVKICEKTLSELFGVNCGTYAMNDQPLHKRLENLISGSKRLADDRAEVDPAKRMRKELVLDNVDKPSGITGTDSSSCPEVLSTLCLMAKPTMTSDSDKSILTIKLSDDMPFLNSSDDMICDTEDNDLSADSKRDQDCDSAAGLQVVDEIVNERLKNLGENMNFSVPLQNELGNSDMNRGQSDFIGNFGNSETSMSPSNSSVISSSMANSSKTSVSNLDLISSYSMTSVPIEQNVTNSVPSGGLSSALEPVTSQAMLGSFSMGLPSLGSFDSLQTQPSTNVHSADSFLDSLSSFETPLTQSCGTSDDPVPSYSGSVMKNSPLLRLDTDSPEQNHPPPKFISSFTPADTSDKPSTPITTAQRLQRSYLELDGGLDVGLDTDLDFEALTEEFNRNTPN